MKDTIAIFIIHNDQTFKFKGRALKIGGKVM